MAEQSKLRVAGENAKQVVRAIGQDESLCLRCTNSESTCQACVDICPGKAVRIPKSTEHAGGFKVTIGKGFCVDCGLCAAVCPMGSISAEDPSQVNGICIKCQACVKKCPTGAKYFDDAAFLSHVAMLEQNFTRPIQAEFFL